MFWWNPFYFFWRAAICSRRKEHSSEIIFESIEVLNRPMDHVIFITSFLAQTKKLVVRRMKYQESTVYSINYLGQKEKVYCKFSILHSLKKTESTVFLSTMCEQHRVNMADFHNRVQSLSYVILLLCIATKMRERSVLPTALLLTSAGLVWI